MSRVASLGMYDHPAQRAANDRLWTALATVLRDLGVADVPDTLDRSRTVHEIWRDPELLFGQVCGYPLVSDRSLSLQLLALPVYTAPGCVGDSHHSVLVARASDEARDLTAFRGRRAAVNDPGSNTGMNLFRAVIAPIADASSFFGSVELTGSHRDSLRSVAAGTADLASIDAVTFAALDRFEPELVRDVRIVARTPVSPTLPFVTGRATDARTVACLQEALAIVCADPDLAGARAELFLSGVVPASLHRFSTLIQFERDAVGAGYPDLR